MCARWWSFSLPTPLWPLLLINYFDNFHATSIPFNWVSNYWLTDSSTEDLKTSSQRSCAWADFVFKIRADSGYASLQNYQWLSPLQQLLTFVVRVPVGVCGLVRQRLKIHTLQRSGPALLFQKNESTKRGEKATRENTIKFCPLHR